MFPWSLYVQSFFRIFYTICIVCVLNTTSTKFNRFQGPRELWNRIKLSCPGSQRVDGTVVGCWDISGGVKKLIRLLYVGKPLTFDDVHETIIKACAPKVTLLTVLKLINDICGLDMNALVGYQKPATECPDSEVTSSSLNKISCESSLCSCCVQKIALTNKNYRL